METKIVKLEQFNKEAVKTFVLNLLQEFPMPAFHQMYDIKNWSGAYLILQMFCKSMPLIVKRYNDEYFYVLTREN